jgi:ABC-type nitrate/sulfonate/bicarbonate transport system substrate-binding protein
MKKVVCMLLFFVFMPAFIQCSVKEKTGPESITILLDWTPNTNHTGLYCADSLGYFEAEGIKVTILLAQEGGTSALVSSGRAPFGISYQEEVTYARSENLPVIAIAAIIQNNTSGFAAPMNRNIYTPRDFEGKRYGGWGSPVEEAMLGTLLMQYGGDISKVEMLTTGAADYISAVQKNMIDFAWIYYGWDGIAAELRDVPLSFFLLQDEDPRLNFYTPVIITTEKIIEERPDFVKKFLRAVTRGYHYAIQNPDEAALILLEAVPELDKDLVMASQRYLSPKYQDNAMKWGEMKAEVWENYTQWLLDNGLLEKMPETNNAFTNKFLP